MYKVEGSEEEDNVYAKSGVSFKTSSREWYVHERVELGCSRLFAIDIGASQASEERKLEAVESLG